jgi:hypothetical protein
MQGARSAETGMYREYMRISSTAQRPVGSALGEPSAAIFKTASQVLPRYTGQPHSERH